MLYCKCGYRVKINAAIKSRVRVAPYPYDCSVCGKRFEITADDVREADNARLKWLDKNYKGKRGKYKK